MRYYGAGKDQVAFVLERFGSGDTFWLWLAGKPVYMPSERSLTLRFGPAGPDQRVRFYRAKADGSPSIVFIRPLSMLPAPRDHGEPEKADAAIDLTAAANHEREKAVTELSIISSGRDLVLELGSMGEPFKAMRACTDHLLATWGFGAAEQQSVGRFPVPLSPPGSWLRPSDYPDIQLLLGRRAMVHFRLNVGADGNPTACYIQGIIGADDFKKAVCAGLMKRAGFEPALDKGGKPKAWYYQNSVVFHVD